MRARSSVPFLALLSLAAPAALRAAPGPVSSGRTTTFRLVRIDGAPSGYVSETREGLPGGGVKTRVESFFRLRRLGGEVEIRQVLTTEEDGEGRVVRLEQRSRMSSQETVSVGVVDGDVLRVRIEQMGRPFENEIDWPDDVIGPAALERRRRALLDRPGSSFSCHQFDFTLGDPFESTFRFVGREAVEIDGSRRSLFHVVNETPLLPKSDLYLDDRGREVLSRTRLMGLDIEMVLADADAVADFVENGVAAEMFVQTMVPSPVRFERPRELSRVVYRVRGRDGRAAPRLPEDSRQRILAADEGSYELEVTLRVPPPDHRGRRPLEHASAALREALAPNPFVQSDAPEIAALAQRIVGDETDPWRAACALEKAVHDLIEQKAFDVAFASALEVLRTRRGDCTEHAVLLAALARAAGIPARVAMGLVYWKGVFGGHAWTEVWIDGDWYGLDATLALGRVDPTHLRLGASTLSGGSLSGALLGLLARVGVLELDVVSYSPSAGSKAATPTEGG